MIYPRMDGSGTTTVNSARKTALNRNSERDALYINTDPLFYFILQFTKPQNSVLISRTRKVSMNLDAGTDNVQ